MTTTRRLDEVTSDLDDLSVTLEEISNEVGHEAARDPEKLDKARAKIQKASEIIEESENPDPPED